MTCVKLNVGLSLAINDGAQQNTATRERATYAMRAYLNSCYSAAHARISWRVHSRSAALRNRLRVRMLLHLKHCGRASLASACKQQFIEI